MANDIPVVADMVADALDLSGTEISNILDAAPFVSLLPSIEASNGTVHSYITHTSNPVVGFIDELVGRDFDHSVDTKVTAELKILDYSFMVPKASADAWKSGGAAAFIAREANRHLRAAMQTLELQVLNNADSSGGFPGFAGLTSLDAAADAMVIDAGGTTADTGSSVYLARVTPDDGISMVYKGDGPIVSFGDTIVQNWIDGTGKNLPKYYTPGNAWFGLQVGGAYSVSRIASLTGDSGAGLTDDLLYEAWSLHPIGQKPTHVVMNRRSLEQLRSSRTATNETGQPAPLPSSALGLPIVVTDQLSNTEALL